MNAFTFNVSGSFMLEEVKKVKKTDDFIIQKGFEQNWNLD